MSDPATETPTPPPPPGPHRLERPRQGRVLGGVAAALAERFDVAPLTVRVAFVVAAFLGGAGIVAYLALWIVLPPEGGPPAAARGRYLVAVGAGLVLILLLVDRPNPLGGGRLVAAAALLTLLLALLDSTRATGRARRAAAAGAGAVLTVVVLVLAGVVVIGPLAGVPLGSGVGSRTVHPSTLAGTYTERMLAGNLVVDLRHARVTSGARLEVSVDVGNVTVIAPPGVDVVVTTRTGLGRAWEDPRFPTVAHARATISLDVGVGVGRIWLRR